MGVGPWDQSLGAREYERLMQQQISSDMYARQMDVAFRNMCGNKVWQGPPPQTMDKKLLLLKGKR